jgi:hypothetical protein
VRTRIACGVDVVVAFLLSGAASGEALSGRAIVPRGVSGAHARIPTGPLIGISRSTGGLVRGFPRVSLAPSIAAGGHIRAIVDDGAGGWYVGGDFQSIGGVSCWSLAHIRRDLTIDRRWCPRPSGIVFALVRLGSTLYVGGDMGRIAGQARRGLAAFNTATGRLTPWNPGDVTTMVWDMAANASGSVIYVSGPFDEVGGARRSNFAALHADSGRATAFAANPDANFHGDSIAGFAVTPTRIYAWGQFSHIGGQPARDAVAALDPGSGRLDAWGHPSNGSWSGTVVAGTTVFVSGWFSRVDGKARAGLAAFDARTGLPKAWAPALGRVNGVNAIASWGNAIVAWFSNGSFAAFAKTSGQLVWRSRIRTAEQTTRGVIATSGNTVVAGGLFRFATSS